MFIHHPFLNYHQICIFFPVSILLILYGCAVGWVSKSFVYFQGADSHIPLSRPEAALIPALFEVGRTMIAIPAGMLGDKIGRKCVIFLCILQHTAAWTLKAFTSNKFLLFLARLLCGTATGTGNAVLFIYAGEIASTEIRGTILSILYTCYYFGILVQFTLGALLTYDEACLATLALCALFFSFYFCIRESPSYLLTKSKEAQAKSNYKWINHGKPEEHLNKEFDLLKQYINKQNENKKNMFSGFSDPVNRKSVTLVFVVNFLTQLTGLPAVVNFARLVFKDVNALSPETFTVIFAATQFLAGCLSTVFADILGRRKTYKITSSLCALSHFFTASILIISNQFGIRIPFEPWMVLTGVTFYACVYASGLGPLTVVLRGELLPQSVKGIGSGLAVVSAGTSCFLLVFIFDFIERYLGLEYNFIFFAINCVLLYALVHVKLPETKHKTLAEIQEIMQKS